MFYLQIHFLLFFVERKKLTKLKIRKSEKRRKNGMRLKKLWEFDVKLLDFSAAVEEIQ